MRRFVFRANDGDHGIQPWISDGTAEGTQLLLDISQGNQPFGSQPTGFEAIGRGRMLFNATDPDHGESLWITKGTAASTHFVFDFDPGSDFGGPLAIASLGDGRALISASDPLHGTELWVTNGTANGTHLVKNIWRGFDDPGPGGTPVAHSSNPSGFFTIHEGAAVFQANDGVHGVELWISDGRNANTQLVKDIDPGAGDSFPGGFVALPGERALFVAGGASTGRELWVTDGTAQGTQMVVEINPGADDGVSAGFGAASPFGRLGADRYLFAGTEAEHGSELWVTDGTAANTHLVEDIQPGRFSIDIEGTIVEGPNSGVVLTSFGALGDGRAVFVADDGEHGRELWVSDGTEAGTQMMKDINPGHADSLPQGSGPVPFATLRDGRVLFSAEDGTHGRELWVTNGSAAGTRMVADLNPGSDGSFPHDFLTLQNGRVVFGADDGTHGVEPWISNGHAGGTHLLLDIDPGSESGIAIPEFTLF